MPGVLLFLELPPSLALDGRLLVPSSRSGPSGELARGLLGGPCVSLLASSSKLPRKISEIEESGGGETGETTCWRLLVISGNCLAGVMSAHNSSIHFMLVC